MSHRTPDAIDAYEHVLRTHPNDAEALPSEAAPGSSEATEAERYTEQIESAEIPG